jgi:hypothetical protein
MARPAGSENKVNEAVRAQFRLLLERQSPKLNEWIDRIAETDPAKAIDSVAKLAEFILPKLARQELTGKDGESLEVNHMHHTIGFVGDTVPKKD